jgi:hypothetical protein
MRVEYVDELGELDAIMRAVGLTARAAPFFAALVDAGTVPLPPGSRLLLLEYLAVLEPRSAVQTDIHRLFLEGYIAAQRHADGAASRGGDAWRHLAARGALDDAMTAAKVAMLLISASETHARETSAAPHPKVH